MLVQKELKNWYIWEYPERWQPWANTVAYFPFENDQLDAVWNAVISTTGTQQTIGYNFNVTDFANITNVTSARFVNYWVKFGSVKSPSWWLSQNQTVSIGYWELVYNYHHTSNEYNQTFSYQSWISSRWHSNTIATTSWVWYNMAYGYDGTKVVAYLNWVQVADITTPLYNTTNWSIWVLIDETLSNLIYETTPRTAEEIQNYYKSTKSNYWL